MSEKTTIEKHSLALFTKGSERKFDSTADVLMSTVTKPDARPFAASLQLYQNMDASTVPRRKSKESVTCTCVESNSEVSPRSTGGNGDDSGDRLYFEDIKYPFNCSLRRACDFQRSLAEFENATIQKQRRELQLLVTELRERDRELNDTVAAHQQQLAGWERDRRRIYTLDEKCSQLERELQNRSDQVYALRAQLHIVESEESNQRSAVKATQGQLSAISEQHSHALLQHTELKERNNRLKLTIQDLRSEFGRYEAREQELLALQAAKDRDFSAATANIAELKSKLKISEAAVGDLRVTEAKLRQTNIDAGQRVTDARRETEHFKREVQRLELHCDELKKEIQRLKLSLLTTGKEVTLSGEREKRKDQLLELQKSKQERTDAELVSLRELYERQHREMILLQTSLENSKELMGRQRKCPAIDSQQSHAYQHVPLEQLMVSTKSFTGFEERGLDGQPSATHLLSGLPDETLIFEMLPERESRDSASVQMASIATRHADTAAETSEDHEMVNKKNFSDGVPEHLASVSSRSVSLQLFSAAGSTSSKSSAPVSGRNSESLVGYPAENGGRQNRFLDRNSCDSPLVMLDEIASSRHTKRDDQFQVIESAAARLPRDVGDQSLDSDGRRCYSAAAVYLASSPIFENGAAKRLYYSAANSVQCNTSSRSLTPAGNSSSGSSARGQAQITTNSYTE